MGDAPMQPTMSFYQNGQAGDYCPFVCETNYGLTKREYFAAMAMQGLLAYKYVAADITAKVAVEYADALLLALSNN
jgi:hypothetical protein